MITKQTLEDALSTMQGYRDAASQADYLMAKTEEYQGWPNRETWAANLHLANTEAWYKEAREVALGFIAFEAVDYEDEGLTERLNASLEARARQEAMEALAKACMGYQEEFYTDTGGMLCDCLNVFLARVQWGAIVEAFAEP